MTDKLNIDKLFSTTSTFSHIGRWAAAFDFVIHSLDRNPIKVLELGSGCIEPIYFAGLLSQDSTLFAVDRTEKIVGYLEKMIKGDKIFLPDLAEIVCDIEKNNKPKLNKDMTDPELIGLGLSQLKSVGLNGKKFYKNGFYGLSASGAKIVAVISDAEEYCINHQNEFDITTLNCVSVHLIREISDSDKAVSILKTIIGTLKEGGALSIGATPSELFGAKTILPIIEKAGGKITDIMTESLVKVEIENKEHILGGILIRVAKSNKEFSKVNIPDFEARVNNEPLFKNISVQKRIIKQKNIGQHLSGNSNNFIIAAIQKDELCVIWEIPVSAIEKIIPLKKRHVLDLLPGLRYQNK